MKNLFRIGGVLLTTVIVCSCKLENKQTKKIEEAENQIDKTLQKTNELKYGRPNSSDSTNEDVDYLINQEK